MLTRTALTRAIPRSTNASSTTTKRYASSASALSPSAHPFLWGTAALLGGIGTYQVLVSRPRRAAALPSDMPGTMSFRDEQERRHKAGILGTSQQSLAADSSSSSASSLSGKAESWIETQERNVKRLADKAKGVLVEKKAFTGGDQGFVDLELTKVEDVNHNTKLFRFKLPEDDMVSGLDVASAILTKFKAEGDEKPTLRPYTPVSDEDAKGFVDLLVKKYPNGPMSTHLHSLAPGDKLSFKGPLPKYPWSSKKHANVAMIAGGTGITPMYQLLRAIFADKADTTTSVTLVFGNQTEPDILLKKELEELENTFPRRFRAFYALDSPPESWTGGKAGHIDKQVLEQVLPGPQAEGVKVFVCGPPGMYKAMSGMKKSPRDQGELSGILKELGYTAEQVYKF